MRIARHRARHALRIPLSLLVLFTTGLAAGSALAQTSYYKGSIVAKKFYDANANGVRDTGEPWLSGWPMTLTGPSIDSTRNSTATWTSLNPGSGYAVREATPVETNWVQTAPRVGGVVVNPRNVSVVACKTITVQFGNYCTKRSGGRTPGFWSNQNGQTKLNDGEGDAPELGMLAALNLVDGAGNAFDPVDYSSFRTWLLASTAVNMAYRLSSHLAAMTLNVEAGYVNGDSFFLPCNCTINELLDDANASLAANPYTPSGHPQRASQEMLKTWLDQLNNGAQVVSATPCRRTFYNGY